MIVQIRFSDANTVQFGSVSVNYSSASITGLQYGKKYYVYCDDPGYLGGSVTYAATTNLQYTVNKCSCGK